MVLDIKDSTLFPHFMAILNHIKYRQGHNGTHSIDAITCTLSYTNGKRTYQAKLQQFDYRIFLGIKEDCDTRSVFNGYVYSIDQFLLIDQLTR